MKWGNGEKLPCSERCFRISVWRWVPQRFGPVNCVFCMYFRGGSWGDELIWWKLNKGVSNVTIFSEAYFCSKGTASKGSSEGNMQPLLYLPQLDTIAKTNVIMMWESRDDFIRYLLGVFFTLMSDCQIHFPGASGKPISSVWPSKFSFGLELLTLD